jgi:hypothetical protein
MNGVLNLSTHIAHFQYHNLLPGEISMPPSIQLSYSFTDLSPFYEHGPTNHASSTPPPALSQTPIIAPNLSRPQQRDLEKAKTSQASSRSKQDTTKKGSSSHSRAGAFPSPPSSETTLGFTPRSRVADFQSLPDAPTSNLPVPHPRSPRTPPYPPSRSKPDAAKTPGSTSNSRVVTFRSPPSSPTPNLPAPHSRGHISASDTSPSSSLQESPSLEKIESKTSRLIPKPEGDAGRPGRGGYNLEVVLGWKKKDFVAVKVLFRHFLSFRLPMLMINFTITTELREGPR